MLSEIEVRALYEACLQVVESGLIEVTIDAHVVEAEQQAKAFAMVLGQPYRPLSRPKAP